MTKRRSPILLLALALAGAAGVAGVVLSRSGPRPRAESQVGATAEPPRFRPSAVAALAPAAALADRHRRAEEAVREAIKTAPGSLGTTAKLPPFDADGFKRDPRSYLEQVVPSRIYQTADPGSVAEKLVAADTARVEVVRGEHVALWVKGAPEAPVTFTSFDGGVFKENGFGTVTVQANANGLAVAHFTAGPGIEGDVAVVAGSPLTVGTQTFFVRVRGARPPG
jgi:hypothetical protein